MTPEIPDGSVVITPTQMYQEIVKTSQGVARLTALVDPALQRINTRLDDQESRLRMVEHWSWKQAGVQAALAAVVAACSSLLTVFLTS